MSTPAKWGAKSGRTNPALLISPSFFVENQQERVGEFILSYIFRKIQVLTWGGAGWHSKIRVQQQPQWHLNVEEGWVARKKNNFRLTQQQSLPKQSVEHFDIVWLCVCVFVWWAVKTSKRRRPAAHQQRNRDSERIEFSSNEAKGPRMHTFRGRFEFLLRLQDRLGGEHTCWVGRCAF